MTHTPEDLRNLAALFEKSRLMDEASMLRAGADAMEKTAQERNLATFRDSLIITAKDEIESLRAKLAALMEQEPVAWMDDGTTRAGSHGNTSHRVVTDETRRHMPNAAASAFTVPLYAAPVPAVTVNPEAIAALTNNQRQLDADGCEVGVSRQALDELLAAVSGHQCNTNSEEQ